MRSECSGHCPGDQHGYSASELLRHCFFHMRHQAFGRLDRILSREMGPLGAFKGRQLRKVFEVNPWRTAFGQQSCPRARARRGPGFDLLHLATHRKTPKDHFATLRPNRFDGRRRVVKACINRFVFSERLPWE